LIRPGWPHLRRTLHVRRLSADRYAATRVGGDAVYWAASLETIAKLAADGIPVIGHVGLVPSKATWTGGFRAVGNTATGALSVYASVKQLEAAGAIGAEIEVVPERVATEIARRTPLILLSMGSGRDADAQYLFAEGVLGSTRGHRPRHAKTYRNFAAEFESPQKMRVEAFTEFKADADSGAYPEAKHIVGIADEEFASCRGRLSLPPRSFAPVSIRNRISVFSRQSRSRNGELSPRRRLPILPRQPCPRTGPKYGNGRLPNVAISLW
jgi:hypothetical protein